MQKVDKLCIYFSYELFSEMERAIKTDICGKLWYDANIGRCDKMHTLVNGNVCLVYLDYSISVNNNVPTQ